MVCEFKLFKNSSGVGELLNGETKLKPQVGAIRCQYCFSNGFMAVPLTFNKDI